MTGPQDKDTLTVTAEQVLDLTVEALQKHLNLSIDGYVCRTLDVLRLLVAASAEQSTIEGACRETKTSPSGNRVREQLEAELPQTLEELRTLEATFNEVLVENLAPRILNRKHQVAMDLILVPYHCEPDQDREPEHDGDRTARQTHTDDDSDECDEECIEDGASEQAETHQPGPFVGADEPEQAEHERSISRIQTQHSEPDDDRKGDSGQNTRSQQAPSPTCCPVRPNLRCRDAKNSSARSAPNQ